MVDQANQLTCPRESIVMWNEGLILERGSDARYRVCNESAVNAALVAMESGETVLLTVGNRVVSKIRIVDGEFHEEFFALD